MSSDIEKQELIKHMFNSARGYGLGYEHFEKCLLSIPDEHFDMFIYTLRRIAEKSGYNGFDY
jgi:hypothetical protein